jgi:hypothetical protein
VSKRKPLPLDDFRWVPVEKAIAEVANQIGSSRDAARYILRELRGKRLRSKCRWRCIGEETLLSDVFWHGHELTADDAFPVYPLSASVSLRDRDFYVWGPDYKNIFGAGVTSKDTKEPVQEKLEKSGRPPTIKWQSLREEIVCRCWQKGRFIPPDNHTDLITELREWHNHKFKSEPNFDDLRKFVGDAIAILKLAGR